MPITANHLSATLRWEFQGSQMQTKRYFRPVGAAFLTADALGVGEAYWNHVKTVWRALVPSSVGSTFKSVIVEEIDGGRTFAEFVVPVAEQTGTRSPTGLAGLMPTFVNVGVRYAVASRVTRPGQMRVPFLDETDSGGNLVVAGFKTLVNALAAVYSTPMGLGAPVATGTLIHEVIRLDPGDPPVVLAAQDVTGFVVNDVITSQRSRRLGRGV